MDHGPGSRMPGASTSDLVGFFFGIFLFSLLGAHRRTDVSDGVEGISMYIHLFLPVEVSLGLKCPKPPSDWQDETGRMRPAPTSVVQAKRSTVEIYG